ncbi:MAG: hypothetical protein KKF89_05240 [Nanoarchaeota archaeon]|nr:hypothetical protein [Nanoarchaeota archaeon]MBU1855099.1 hypothetical protein [Nanoarchaeota archaeon]
MKKGSIWNSLLYILLGIAVLITVVMLNKEKLIPLYKDITSMGENNPLGDEIRIISIEPESFSKDELVTIKYELKSVLEKADFKMKIYDIDEELQLTFTYKDQKTGENTIRWNGKDKEDKSLPAGTYYIVLEVTGDKTKLEEGKILKQT